jgi:histidine ammonia-lyase
MFPFHGDYVALEMDKIKIAITRLSMLMERQLNFLNDNKPKTSAFCQFRKIRL